METEFQQAFKNAMMAKDSVLREKQNQNKELQQQIVMLRGQQSRPQSPTINRGLANLNSSLNQRFNNDIAKEASRPFNNPEMTSLASQFMTMQVPVNNTLMAKQIPQNNMESPTKHSMEAPCPLTPQLSRVDLKSKNQNHGLFQTFTETPKPRNNPFQ